MDQQELKYWLSFSQIPVLGPVRMQKIIKSSPSLKKAWGNSYKEFLAIGFDDKITEQILDARKDIDPDKELEKLEKEKVSAVTIQDDAYPRLLRETYGHPPILYYRGLLGISQFTLAVVGTRKVSPYGKEVTSSLVNELSGFGLTIVSGLALGVDTIAHDATLNAHGLTCAVLGSGLDDNNIYPASNRYLAKKIIDSKGALFSEYPIGTHPHKMNFPQRNRIISGLTLGTLVTEAPEDSGALITARYALDQNREVFAVPGNIYNVNSQGTNTLIKMGAKLVSSSQDILDTFNIQKPILKIPEQQMLILSQEEKNILSIMAKEPIHLDDIIRKSHINAGKAVSLITLLEINGSIRNAGNGMYRKT